MKIDIDFQIPGFIEYMIEDANSNLFYGPSASEHSFTKAVEVLRDWWDNYEFNSDLWYDYQTGEVSIKNECPEDFIEPVFIDVCDVRRKVFGRELAPYI